MKHVLLDWCESNVVLTSLLVAICACLVVRWFVQKPRNLPPGPIGVPILGYLPFISKDAPRKLDSLKKKYGGVFGLYLGSRYVVVLCDFPSVKEAFSKDAFLGRPPDFPFAINKDSEGIMVINGKAWREQRRFALQVLKNLGYGTLSMEAHIKEEISHLMKELQGVEGKPANLSTLLTPSMSNIISSLVFGKRFEHEDPQRVYLDHLIEEIPKRAGQSSYFLFLPWLKWFLLYFGLGSVEKLRVALKCREDFAETKIKGHEETFDHEVIRDYIDGFLHKMKLLENTKDHSFTKNVLKGNVSSFFGAGSETVKTTVDWLLLVCAAFPEVQRRVHQEIDESLGRDREPSWDDMKRLPYSQAVIWEVFRWKPINPLNLLRYTTEDTGVRGYFIPKGSMVINCIWSIHNDPENWEKPQEFNPCRFLSKDGKSAEKPEYLIPFSYGKRSCPGEVLAVVEVFLYFTSILQRFTVEPPEHCDITFEEVLGVSLRPKPQNLVLRSRN